ncbi:MAG: oligosaccharide flippase family protein, partial [Ignavibacteriaceae bacterium]|nr:oligosaccharide flippase family protein [Ignavibacteriaceae bacterium]
MKGKFLFSSFTGGGQILINSLLMIIAIPMFISKLGLEEYSIFSLLMVIGNLNVFLNLGLNSTLIKFLAEQGKTEQSNSDITSGLLVLLFILIPFSYLGIHFNDFFIVKIFSIDYLTNEKLNAVKVFFNLILISNSIIIFGQIFTAILDSIQKVYLSNIAQMIYNITFWSLILVSIYTAGSLESIGMSIIASAILWLIIVLFLARKNWGSFIFLSSKNILISSLKKQTSYGSKLYLSSTISFFYEPLSKILISHFIGLNEVGYFDIALRIKNQIWNLLSRLLYPLFPYISIISDKKKLDDIISSALKLLFWVIAPLLVSSLFLANPLIHVWLGKNEVPISVGVQFMMSGYLFAVTVIPVYFFLMAKGFPQKTIIMQLLNVVVNIFVFFLLLKYLNYYAIIVSNFAAIFSTTLLSIYYKHKLISPIT